jgi:hypothetical protein
VLLVNGFDSYDEVIDGLSDNLMLRNFKQLCALKDLTEEQAKELVRGNNDGTKFRDYMLPKDTFSMLQFRSAIASFISCIMAYRGTCSPNTLIFVES